MSKPKLLADENIPRNVIVKLRSKGYDVLSIWESSPGISDGEVVQLAMKTGRAIITFDKDFGRIAMLEGTVPGIILLRIPPRNPEYITRRLLRALKEIRDPHGKLVIVRKGRIKIVEI